MWRTDRQTDRQTTSCDSDMHNAYHRAVIKTTMIVMMMMMMMMMQVYVESNESNFVHQLVVNSSLTDVHIDNLPDNISSYVVQVSAFNRVASSPHSTPVLVGQFLFFSIYYCYHRHHPIVLGLLLLLCFSALLPKT